MRIIAGEFRGRRLLAPESETTRPITDRVKQSVFDILAPHIPDARIYDVFAGTGSMGLECLSRGAVHATFFERDRSALKLLKRNIEALNVAASTAVIEADLFGWFESTRPDPSKTNKIELIFLDPPYRMLREDAAKLQTLASGIADKFLASDGLVIFRHDSADALDLPPLRRVDQRTYGGMTVELLAHHASTPQDG